MTYRIIYIYIFGLLATYTTLRAQEQAFLDDSTKEVYGIHTTTFVTPEMVKYNQGKVCPVTISISNIDRFTRRQQSFYSVQDLGNEGTPTKSIFYKPPQWIGFHSGFYVYDLFFKDLLQQRHYDAKAPYTDGTVVFANFGSYLFNVTHARSFNKNWHVSAIFESMLIDREHIPEKIPYDRQVLTYPFTLLAHYQTDHAFYQVFVGFYRKMHRNRETGGISNEEGANSQGAQNSEQTKPKGSKTKRKANNKPLDWLRPKALIDNNIAIEDSLETSELRQQYFLYHEINLHPPLQIYHEANLTNTFNHTQSGPFKSKRSKLYLIDDIADHQFTLNNNNFKLQNSTITQVNQHELGIKGDVNRVFYQYYYQQRYIKLQEANKNFHWEFLEQYLGIYGRIHLHDRIGDLHLSGKVMKDNLYKIGAAYQGPWGVLSYDEVRCQPPWIAKSYKSPYRNWYKKFTPPLHRQLFVAPCLSLPNLRMQPYGKWALIENPIAFKKRNNQQPVNTALMPFQAAGNAFITTWGGQLDFTLFSYFHFDSQVETSQIEGPAAVAFSFPTWYLANRSYYKKAFYGDKSEIETGFDISWKPEYYPDGYDPITQQFFLQNDFVANSYVMLELFFNFRIKTFRGFVKIINFLQGWPIPGYYLTPFYPGQYRSVDFGVSWSLFD